jgi:HAD superfamily hydrolase (TIGR01509 family)
MKREKQSIQKTEPGAGLPEKPFIQAVVFDLDGVLVDSEGLHARAWEQVFQARGLPVPEDIEGRFTGVADVKVAEILGVEYGIPGERGRLLGEKRRAYKDLVKNGLHSYPGVVEEIDRLRKDFPGLKLGVATSSGKGETLRMLKICGLEGRFGVVVTADDVRNLKPAPESYLLACSRLGVTPKEAGAVEDSPAGIEAALAAGMYVIAVPTTREPDALSAAPEIADAPETAESPARAIKKLREYLGGGI